MIFRIHYILFNAGLSAITIMLTVFLQRYSDASPSEIGTLLMILPFMCVITKPVFCALADRHKAHLVYFVSGIGVQLVGYGSYIILPFFPEFVEQHGRASWYILVVLTIIGYNAFGVTWSLGDAFVVNKCYRTNQKFGMFRLWGTVSWAIFGTLIGQFNQVDFLPDYVPAFLVMIVSLIIEIIVMLTWPYKEDFIMGDQVTSNQAITGSMKSSRNASITRANMVDSQTEMEPIPSAYMPSGMSGSLRLSSKAVSTLANMVKEDFSNTITSLKSIGGNSHAHVVDHQDIQKGNQHADNHYQIIDITTGQQQQQQQVATHNTNVSVSSRTSAGRVRYPLYKTLSTVSYHPEKLDHQMLTSSPLASQRQFVPLPPKSTGAKPGDLITINGMGMVEAKGASSKDELHTDKEDLQLVIIKMIITRDMEFWKFIIIFVLFGALFNINVSFFFLHLEVLTQEAGIFSQLVGLCTMSQGIAETICFLISPWMVTKFGRDGSISFCLAVFVFRYLFNGLIFEDLSPYVCLLIEPCHGIIYGIAYYIVTDISLHFTIQVDKFIPELMERKLIEPNVDVNDVKNAVRATMQGIFSGAFDGLGSGLGALLAGIILENHSYTYLWCLCGILAAIIGVAHQLFMIFSLCKRKKAKL